MALKRATASVHSFTTALPPLDSINSLVGLTIRCITGGAVGDDKLVFLLADGRRCMLHHEQDCCERVTINEVHGDYDDLLDAPLLVADERVGELPAEARARQIARELLGKDGDSESCTWTFYRFTTIKGTVTVRWLGESNGYYSESVDFAPCVRENGTVVWRWDHDAAEYGMDTHGD